MIRVNLTKVMFDRQISLTKLAEEVNITQANLSNLKNGKVKGLRFKTLAKICQALECQPGDILEYIPENTEK